MAPFLAVCRFAAVVGAWPLYWLDMRHCYA